MCRLSQLKTFVTGALVSLGAAGCQQPPAGDLDALTIDFNNNGFPEVQPPDGVTFDEFGSINVGVSSELTRQDAGVFLEQIGLDAALVNLGTLTFEIAMTLDYGNGVTDVIEDTETLEPFSNLFEVACPESATIAIGVIVAVPFLGSQQISDLQFELQEGTDFNCGETIEARVGVNEAGLPEFQVEVSS